MPRSRRNRGWLALAAAAAIQGLSTLPAGAQTASEVYLYDDDNCTGEYRALIDSLQDFDIIDFDNEVDSVRVISGTWSFYRDAGYGTGNGPPFSLGPSPTTCWSVEDASGGQFPDDRMSSVQLTQQTPGTPPPAVILFDNTNFNGSGRLLTAAEPNFDNIDFDNDTESVRVLNGTWTLYRDANYGAPPDRPSVTLGPGDYPDIANVPGYPPGTFPGDLMSSAMPVAGAPPPPPPQDDPPPPPPPECNPTYQFLDTSVNPPVCRFNCHQSTQPDPASGQCVCLPGTVEAGQLNDGRRYCLGNPGNQQPPATETRYDVPAAQAIGYAQQRGWGFSTQVSGPTACIQAGNQVILMPNPALLGQQVTCTATFFANRQLAPGWRFESYQAQAMQGTYTPTGLVGQLPFTLNLTVPNGLMQGLAVVNTIRLYGPSGRNWQEAFQ